jgi:pilus assembly protein Flp/PilA
MRDMIRNLARQLGRDRRGATAIEYGLIMGLIALAIVGSIAQVGPAVKNNLEAADNGFPD